MYAPLLPCAARFITVTPDSPRALPAQELAAYLAPLGKPVTACASVAEGAALALDSALTARERRQHGAGGQVQDLREAVAHVGRIDAVEQGDRWHDDRAHAQADAQRQPHRVVRNRCRPELPVHGSSR